ncbi:MAG TPA: hypothetical protein VGF79_02040 [Bacteroidia bacterium]
MKKQILFCSLSLMAASSMLFFNSCKKTTEEPTTKNNNAQTSLLQDAQKGKPFNSGIINDFTLAYSNDQVLMLAVNNSTGMVYAIDLEDNNAGSASANEITGNVSDFGTKLAAAMGTQASNLSILNMEVNPISKNVYLLAFNNSNNSSSVIKVSAAGTSVTVLDLSNVTYSSISYSASGERVNDIAWGNNTLFLSFSHASTLVGRVGSIKAPFKHNASMSNRATTVFKTNWGGNYFTDAPLESMCFADVAGEKRLMGVTVCAPGYSFKADEVSNGAGLLQVKEFFNLNTGSALKVYTINQNGKTYLIEHHMNGRITRIGEKYLDESQTNFNASAKYLLSVSGNVASGLGDEDVKIIEPSGTYIFSAKISDSKLLAMAGDGSLSVIGL